LPQALVPVLCDTDPATGGIDLDDAACRITKRTAALAVTHLFGRPVPADPLRRFCNQHHLALVEDCSHAHGATWRGRPVGTSADVAIFSCGTWKMCSGGKAGLLATPDRAVWERAHVLAQPKHRALARVRDTRLRALAQSGVGHNRRATPRGRPGRGSPAPPGAHGGHEERAPAGRGGTPGPAPARAGAAARSGRTAGALYKLHWCLTDGPPPHEVVTALRAAGVKAWLPAQPLHQLPPFTDPDLATLLDLPRPAQAAPDSFPGTSRFLADLVEIDTRDLYEPLPDGDPDPYDHALAAAAERLSAAVT
ncbi:DegT/DnrJ/EryC1/StrS family aminotransferase, partial [Streptomyces sp. NPDC029554]|uniref:DegT/DnrJ/EryC1/StrS family aminotransferase n=1 Tax=Streptomyces sp. NPDC029554 TaxID=3155126 RepID=UPI0033F9A988